MNSLAIDKTYKIVLSVKSIFNLDYFVFFLFGPMDHI